MAQGQQQQQQQQNGDNGDDDDDETPEVVDEIPYPNNPGARITRETQRRQREADQHIMGLTPAQRTLHLQRVETNLAARRARDQHRQTAYVHRERRKARIAKQRTEERLRRGEITRSQARQIEQKIERRLDEKIGITPEFQKGERLKLYYNPSIKYNAYDALKRVEKYPVGVKLKQIHPRDRFLLNNATQSSLSLNSTLTQSGKTFLINRHKQDVGTVETVPKGTKLEEIVKSLERRAEKKDFLAQVAGVVALGPASLQGLANFVNFIEPANLVTVLATPEKRDALWKAVKETKLLPKRGVKGSGLRNAAMFEFYVALVSMRLIPGSRLKGIPGGLNYPRQVRAQLTRGGGLIKAGDRVVLSGDKLSESFKRSVGNVKNPRTQRPTYAKSPGEAVKIAKKHVTGSGLVSTTQVGLKIGRKPVDVGRFAPRQLEIYNKLSDKNKKLLFQWVTGIKSNKVYSKDELSKLGKLKVKRRVSLTTLELKSLETALNKFGHGRGAVQSGLFATPGFTIRPGRLEPLYKGLYGDTRPKAFGVVLNDKNQVLLVKRAQNPGKGKWTIPGGLHDKGGTYGKAAMREILEETGIRAKVSNSLLHLRRTNTQIFKAKASNSNIKIDRKELLDARWFDYSKIPENLAFPKTDLHVIRKAYGRAGVLDRPIDKLTETIFRKPNISLKPRSVGTVYILDGKIYGLTKEMYNFYVKNRNNPKIRATILSKFQDNKGRLMTPIEPGREIEGAFPPGTFLQRTKFLGYVENPNPQRPHTPLVALRAVKPPKKTIIQLQNQLKGVSKNSKAYNDISKEIKHAREYNKLAKKSSKSSPIKPADVKSRTIPYLVRPRVKSTASRRTSSSITSKRNLIQKGSAKSLISKTGGSGKRTTTAKSPPSIRSPPTTGSPPTKASGVSRTGVKSKTVKKAKKRRDKDLDRNKRKKPAVKKVSGVKGYFVFIGNKRLTKVPLSKGDSLDYLSHRLKESKKHKIGFVRPGIGGRRLQELDVKLKGHFLKYRKSYKLGRRLNAIVLQKVK